MKPVFVPAGSIAPGRHRVRLSEHLHACVTDGVFTSAATATDGVAFLPARPISPADLATLSERVRRRLVRWFRRRRLQAHDDRDVVQAASDDFPVIDIHAL